MSTAVTDLTAKCRELRGTEKQIAWARDLRQHFIDEALAARDEFVREEELAVFGEHIPGRFAQMCVDYEMAVGKVLWSEANASGWIEMRYWRPLDRVAPRIRWTVLSEEVT